MMYRSRVACLLAATFALGGCAIPTESESTESVGKAASPVLNGYADPGTGLDGTPHNDANVVSVVADFGNGGFGICSGSLLAPNMVLTAHHCVADIMPEGGGVDCASSSFGAPYSASIFLVTTQSPIPMTADGYVGVSEVALPSTATGVCGNDVAILILSTSIPSTQAAPLVPRVDTPIKPQDIFSAVGYGGTTDSGADAGTRRRRDGLIVDCVEGDCPIEMQVSAREWQGNEGTCEGDSGGPALDTKGRPTGVTSRGLQGCQAPTYGYIFGYADWIKQEAQHAAMVGGYNPAPWVTGFPTDPAYTAAIGAKCDDASTCPGGLCVGGICSRPCNDVATCGDGFSCNKDDQCQKGSGDTGSGGGSDGSAASSDDGGCGCEVVADPTKPVPWYFAGGALALAAIRRRRRNRR